jgi:hypothetical protein
LRATGIPMADVEDVIVKSLKNWSPSN